MSNCVADCQGFHNPCVVRGCRSPGCFALTITCGCTLPLCPDHARRSWFGKDLKPGVHQAACRRGAKAPPARRRSKR